MTLPKRLALATMALAAVFMLAVTACDKRSAVRPDMARDTGSAQAEAAGVMTAAAETPLYERDIQPLSTEQCAGCHLSIFRKIKQDGGRHRIECSRCHTQYHAYNPGKDNYAEIMPKCGGCHSDAAGGPFHGNDPALTGCAECHGDPHRPLVIPMAAIEGRCGKCHSEEHGRIQANPSAHSDMVGCSDCHAEAHGHIPQCSDCHSNHSPDVPMESAQCMTCHPVHMPTNISYPKESSSLVCAGCHAEVHRQLTDNVTKHTAELCSHCHPNHKDIEPCSTCHGEPHSSEMMRDTSKCNQCHGTAHSLAAD